MMRPSHGQKGCSIQYSCDREGTVAKFAEDRGTSRRFFDEGRSLLSAAEVRDHLVFHTLSSTAYKRSAEVHATNVGCQTAHRMVSDHI